MATISRKRLASPYGSGISVIPDINPRMSSVNGVERVAEALVLRLTGRWFYDDDYGLDLLNLLCADVTDTRDIALRVERELLKDDRVKQVSAETSLDSEGRLQVAIVVVLKLGGEFALVGRVIGDIAASELMFDVLDVTS